MIVTLTTDFGLQDHFVGTMKGVVLGINPNATLVDISHNVAPFDILDGALTIAAAYDYFPPGTIHVVVVDPGVGTTRRPIVAHAERHTFIGPDNGVLSLVFKREQELEVRHITEDTLFLHPLSATFHGRDIFASVAGHISNGTDLSRLGPIITDFLHLPIPTPVTEANRITGTVLKQDRFGNLITNINGALLPQFVTSQEHKVAVRVGSTEIDGLSITFGEVEPGKLCALIGSMGYLEIAVNQGSAAESLHVQSGDLVEVLLG